MEFLKTKNMEEMSKNYKMQKYSYDLEKIAVFNPYNFEEVFVLENEIISKIDKKKIKKNDLKKHLITSYIPYQNIIQYELKIPKSLIDKIDLYDHIETQAYEELGLDETEKYVFKYKLIETITDEKNVIAQVAIVKENFLKSYFKPLIDEYNYVDFIGCSGFLYEVLYRKNILPSPSKDVFVFFTKEVILVSLYSDGNFLQNIVLNEGLQSLYERLANDKEIEIKNFNYDVFLELITKKGVNSNHYDEVEEPLFNKVSEILGASFNKIVIQLNTLQRKYGLPVIDKVFISTEGGPIEGVDRFSKSHFNEIIIQELKFDEQNNPRHVKINQLLFLTMLSAKYAYEEEYQDNNFTIKKRPPTFFYRTSGQFISLVVASLILSLAYPAYQYVYTIVKTNENKTLEKRSDYLEREVKKFSAINAQLIKKVKEKEAIVSQKKEYIKSVEKNIATLHKEKKGYIPISRLLSKITIDMQKNNVHTTEISLDKKVLELNITADKDSYITNFTTQLVTKEKLNVETNGIIKDENVSKYYSIVKVHL